MDNRPDVLVLSINYSPEPTGFAPHVTAFCEHLARKGQAVTVLTGFPFAPRWKRWPDYPRRFVLEEHRGGVRVVRNTHFVPRHPGRMLERVLMEASFCLSALFSLLRFQLRPKVLIYVGAQPSIAMLCRFVSAITGVKYGLIINDLATGAAQDVGIVKSALISRTLQRFEYSAYHSAAQAVVLCEGFKRALVAGGYPENLIRIVRSPVNLAQITPMASGNAFRHRFGIAPHAFVILFAGSMGLKQGLENVIQAARILASENMKYKWILVGDGETRAQIENLVRELKLEASVTLLPFQPEDQMSEMFAAADVLLLNQLSAVKDTVIPSKLLTYMSAGRPVIAAVNASSQGAELLLQSGGGAVIPPENPIALANAVQKMSAEPDRMDQMGRANRLFAVENFDQEKIMQRLEQFAVELALTEQEVKEISK